MKFFALALASLALVACSDNGEQIASYCEAHPNNSSVCQEK